MNCELLQKNFIQSPNNPTTDPMTTILYYILTYLFYLRLQQAQSISQSFDILEGLHWNIAFHWNIGEALLVSSATQEWEG